MDIADGPAIGDTTLLINDLQVFLERNADSLLSGATIDFSEAQGFVISGMPKRSCC